MSAVCDSAYFEQVLNVKVPTMTSDTTPSGEVFFSSFLPDYAPAYYAYRAFDNSENGWCPSTNGENSYVGYKFSQAMCAKKFVIKTIGDAHNINIKIQASNDAFLNEIVELGSFNKPSQNSIMSDIYTKDIIINTNKKYKSYRIYSTFYYADTYGYKFQMYGR